MDLFNSLLNLVVPPASLFMLGFAWPALSFIQACEWLYKNLNSEDMENKVVVITGASSGIGEHIAYEYAKRGANLVLVARRADRLRWISENALQMGARHVMIIAADVVKEEECRRFITETFNYYGRYIRTGHISSILLSVDHLVNTASLGHTFYVEEVGDTSVFPLLMDINFWGNVYPTFAALPYLRQCKGRVVVNASVEGWLPMPRMSLYAASKAAVTNFYETLRLEVKDDVGVTIATHGWIGGDMTRGKFMLEEGSEMQWKEEREAPVVGSRVEEYARLIVSGACRGDPYVKLPSWYDIFLLYKVFAPDILGWTYRLLFSGHDARKRSIVGAGRPALEAAPAQKLLSGPPMAHSLQQQ